MLAHTDSANGFGRDTCTPSDPIPNVRLQSQCLLVGGLRTRGLDRVALFVGVLIDSGYA